MELVARGYSIVIMSRVLTLILITITQIQLQLHESNIIIKTLHLPLSLI